MDSVRPAEPINLTALGSCLPAAAAAEARPLRDLVRRAPHAAILFWAYLLIVLSTGFVADVLLGPARSPARLLVSAGAVTVATAAFAVIHRRVLSPQLAAPRADDPYAWLGLVGLMPLLAFNFLYHDLLAAAGFSAPTTAASAPAGLLSPGSLLLLVCVLPALTEEVAFRGLLQPLLAAALDPLRALLLTSALFAALHFSVLSAPYLLLVGLFLGYVRDRTGSLYPPMLLHLLHNLAAVTLLRF